MSTDRETLAEFVKRTMAEKGLSYRRVAENSNGAISHSTVADIANAQRFDIKRDTLKGLAKGLGVSLDDVLRIAGGLSIDQSKSKRFEIYAEFFDARDISENEWSWLEDYFREHVQNLQRIKAEYYEKLQSKEFQDYIKENDGK